MKRSIIIILGIVSLIFNFINSNNIELDINYQVLIKGFIPDIITNDSYMGQLTDIFIYLIFFNNIKKIIVIPGIFGGY